MLDFMVNIHIGLFLVWVAKYIGSHAQYIQTKLIFIKK